MSIIHRDGAPSHLFAISELDFSSDLFADPLQQQWFRLGARTIGNDADERGVRDITERQSLLLKTGEFEAICEDLSYIGNDLSHLGAPTEEIQHGPKAEKAYTYRPFYAFDIAFTDVVGEPLAFFPKADGEQQIILNADLTLYFELIEKPHGSGNWWDPARSVEVIRQQRLEALEFVEIRTDYLLKYLRVRRCALVTGHYRHFHFLNASDAAIAALQEGEIVLSGPNSSKATIQTWQSEELGGRPLLIRRLHLWSQVPAPPFDIETAFNEEPEFDVANFTFPMRVGEVAPGRYRHRGEVGIAFAGVAADFMERVYFRQDVLAKYQGASGFSVDDNGSLHCGYHWGLTRSTRRIGNELLSTAIGDFAEGLPYHEWLHWQQHVVPTPTREMIKALEKEMPIPDAVNWVIEQLTELNEAFNRFARAAGAHETGKLWTGSLDSLAGRQLKWIYPATAGDEEFLTRTTLASTLFLDALNSAGLRNLLNAFGGALHQTDDNKTLGSRNLLQRTALLAQLISAQRPNQGELPSLIKWSEDRSGAPDADLQSELTRQYDELREDFGPLAFLYDLRTGGGLAHPPNAKKTIEAAKALGLRDKDWRRADFLHVLQQVGSAVEAVRLRVDAASNAVP